MIGDFGHVSMCPAINIVSANNVSASEGIEKGGSDGTSRGECQAVFGLFEGREGSFETFSCIVSGAGVFVFRGADFGLRKGCRETDGGDDCIGRGIRVRASMDCGSRDTKGSRFGHY